MPEHHCDVRPVIYESWRRSRLQGLAPAGVAPRLEAGLDLDSHLARVTDSVVSRRVDALDHASCSLCLTDASGRILRRWVPDATFAARLDALDVKPGYSVMESDVGTTSAICLLTGERLLVQGPEHFCAAFQNLSCAGAPILHPVTRRVVGSLNLTCSLDDTTPLVLSWVTGLAAEVASALAAAASRREQLLLEAYLTHNRDTRHPLVVLNEHTIISNAAAARLLNGLDQAMLWEHAVQACGRTGSSPLLIADDEQVTIDCRPVIDGTESIGAVLQVRSNAPKAQRRSPAEEVADLPGLVGRSPRWRALCRQVASAGGGPVLLVGEAGSGRLAVARAMEPRGPLRVLDADDAVRVGAERWTADVERLVDGPDEVLVLRHIDRIDPALAAATAAALRRRPSRRRVLATSEVGAFAGGASRPLLQIFATEIEVPALRERLEDLPLLLSAFTTRATGGATVRWMPDAVQALSRVEWSGNLTALEALVRRMVARGSGGYLGAGDLPPELVARASRRRLARLEHAEAQTILHALRDSGGNKHRAAESLGIARSTLYRKVRALGLDLSTAAY